MEPNILQRETAPESANGALGESAFSGEAGLGVAAPAFQLQASSANPVPNVSPDGGPVQCRLWMGSRKQKEANLVLPGVDLEDGDKAALEAKSAGTTELETDLRELETAQNAN